MEAAHPVNQGYLHAPISVPLAAEPLLYVGAKTTRRAVAGHRPTESLGKAPFIHIYRSSICVIQSHVLFLNALKQTAKMFQPRLLIDVR
jgi:hypothetical protein